MPDSVIAEKKSITAGALNVRDAYNLKFKHLKTGNYSLVVFMKLQFFFEDAKPYYWTSLQRKMYIQNWENAIKKQWGGRVLKKLHSGSKVILSFDFKIQEAGWMFDNWEITVRKIKPGSFETSYVTPGQGNVRLDSEDLTPVTKAAGFKQRGAIHEFGHMIGLEDEYKSSFYSSDISSIMHSGELIRSRHDSTIMKWLNHILVANKIK